MKTIFLQFAICFVCNFLFAQGSGYSVNLDGTNDYVKPTGTDADNYSTPTNFTIEAWARPSALSSTVSCISAFSSWNIAGNDKGIVFGLKSTGMYFHIWNGSSGVFRNYTISATISTTEYSHFAITKSGSNLVFYMNGIQIGTVSNCDNYTSTSTLNVTIGEERYNNLPSKYFSGDIDEFRFWNYAKTQTEIRNGMCMKMASGTSGLLSYFRFDESTGTSSSDFGSMSANATFYNFAMSGTTSNRLLSKAPIGDTSICLYTGTWGGQSLFLNSLSNGSFTVNNVSGTPSGVHVYRVDESPNSLIGIAGELTNDDVYFGTFVVDGTSPTYSVAYDYADYNEAVTDESIIGLFYRDNNADLDWIDLGAVQDVSAHTFTKANLTQRGEFIIEINSVVLPLGLIQFDAEYIKENNSVLLSWATSSEVEVDHYAIERSIDGSNFDVFSIVDRKEDLQATQDYQEQDLHPLGGVSYYRLNYTDNNGKVHYTEMRSVIISSTGDLSVLVYPNPGQEEQMHFNISTTSKSPVQLTFSDASGKVLFQEVLNGENLYDYTFRQEMPRNRGVVFFQIIQNEEVKNIKLICL